MHKIDAEAIENIAVGAALLGTGGGGDPYIGKMMALSAINEYGPAHLVSPDEVDENAMYAPAAMMGAPSVLVEKFPKGDEFVRVFQKLEKYLGKEIKGVFPMEAGGVNSMIPIIVAAQLGLPLIDCDGMGRAFPELQMVTFHLNGVSSTPMAITDEKGNIGIIETVDNVWAERLARTATVEMGASTLISNYPSSGSELKRFGIANIVSLSEKLGRIIRSNEKDNQAKLRKVLDITGGYDLFTGKIVDVLRGTEGGFNRGKVIIEGLAEYTDEEVNVYIQNENLIALKNGHPLVLTPDLICLVDLETLTPVTTESLKYGKRVRLLALPCNKQWRSAKGIETVGPRYFGYDYDYVPVEELVRKERGQ